MSQAKVIEIDVSRIPLDEIDVSNPYLFQNDTIGNISDGCAPKTRCIIAPIAVWDRTGR